MYVVSFIDSGKLVQVTTPSAAVAATLVGYVPSARVFKADKLVRDIQWHAAAAELRQHGARRIAEQRQCQTMGRYVTGI